VACLALANYKHFNVSLGNILIINEDKIMHHTTNLMLPRSQTRGRQQGFSIIELMIVLAVAGMLIVGALVAGTTVMNGVKANRYVNEISTIATQTRAWKGVKTDYSGLGNGTSTDCDSDTDTDTVEGICMLVAMGRLPNATNSEGGIYSVAAGVPPKTFIITSNGMTKEICLDVAEQIQGQTLGTPASGTGDNTVEATSGATCDETELSATFK
jgi:prepilin-type N-terminal cleavage/methylation domain-containing protein